MTLSIRNKIILLITAVSLIIGILGGLSFIFSVNEADHVAQHEAVAISRALAFELTTCPWGRPEGGPEINSYIHEVSRHLFRDIVVVDPNQKIIGAVVESEVGAKFTHDPGDEVGMTLKDGITRVFTEVSDSYPKGIRQMVMSLDAHGGKRLGALILEYTPLYNEMLSQAKTKAKRLLVFYVIAIGLSLLAGYIFALKIIRPIKKIRDAAGQIASGNFDASVKYDHPDEIGDLASSFNKMAEEIKSSHQELLKANMNLSQSEKKFRNLFNSSTDGIFLLDMKGNFLDVNFTAYTRLGYTKEEMLSLHISQLDSPEFADRVPERLAEITERGYAVFESAHLRKDGSVMPVEVNSKILGHEGQRVFFSVIRDITERKKAEEKLRRSEEFIRGILDTVDEGFIVVNRDYRIQTANKAYCKQTGGCDKEIIGSHCYEVSHKIKRPCFEEGEECAVRQVFETGKPQTVFHKHPDKDGHILFLETKAYPIKDDIGNVISVIETINNITERHLLDEERLKTQKLESIGTLAGGLANDFNNLLQGVFGYISMAKLRIASPKDSLMLLSQAEKALTMSVDLTKQLLTFSKGGKPVKKLIRLEPVIKNSVKFALSGSHTDYRVDVAEDLWPVEVDEVQLAQVIQNVVINANEAMAGRGTVNVSAKNMDIPPKANLLLPKGGRFVLIDIQDSGKGISGQNLEKIFDPYFTTKDKGSGLGLATSYTIIKNHGGIIGVSSELNRGTTFTIFLPASTDAGVEAKAVPAAIAGGRKGKVLLMDDEEMIRSIAKEMIKALGHEVETAEEGNAAIEMFRHAREAGSPFDVVVLDLKVKGGMDGEATIQKILEIDPDVKAVVSSGYEDSPIISNYRAYGFSAFLNKPYKIDALKDCLNAYLP
jgi:PAS domain S-box-containing protein